MSIYDSLIIDGTKNELKETRGLIQLAFQEIEVYLWNLFL